jgi:hypothetical protein
METTTIALPDFSKMNLAELASTIRKDWRKVAKNGIYFGAVPYLDAMSGMDSVKDNYGMDSGSSIVMYFLANAQTWKGEVAKAIKAELNKRLKSGR